jgi:hypothetical protein
MDRGKLPFLRSKAFADSPSRLLLELRRATKYSGRHGVSVETRVYGDRMHQSSDPRDGSTKRETSRKRVSSKLIISTVAIDSEYFLSLPIA